jgi:cell division protein FtsB
MRDVAYDRRDERGGRQRDMRSRQARDTHAGSRAGQRNVAQANQYSRDRYVSQPGQQRGASVSQQNYAKARRVKPVDPRALLAAAVIAVVLAVVIIVRFVLFGGTASEYGVAKAAIDQQQSQLTELQTSNEDLQAQIDSMQGLIERYDNSGKK